tara:strand:- start:470 stop:733 length:264 start_codon:yes stop_codon:yes gene_type:complete
MGVGVSSAVQPFKLEDLTFLHKKWLSQFLGKNGSTPSAEFIQNEFEALFGRPVEKEAVHVFVPHSIRRGTKSKRSVGHKTHSSFVAL